MTPEALLLPILLFIACATALSVGMLLAPAILAPSTQGRVKEMPYESGMDPVHDTRRRFDIRFHLVAIAFLIFDVELLLLYPWAVASHNPEGIDRVLGTLPAAVSPATIDAATVNTATLNTTTLNTVANDAAVQAAVVGADRWLVFGGILFFLLLVVLGLVYEWRKGVLQWR